MENIMSEYIVFSHSHCGTYKRIDHYDDAVSAGHCMRKAPENGFHRSWLLYKSGDNSYRGIVWVSIAGIDHEVDLKVTIEPEEKTCRLTGNPYRFVRIGDELFEIHSNGNVTSCYIPTVTIAS